MAVCQRTGDGGCGRCTLNISPKNTNTTYPLCPSLNFKRKARWIRAIPALSDYQYMALCELTGDGGCGRCTLNISPKYKRTNTTYPLCPSLTFTRTARWDRAIHALSDYQYMALCQLTGDGGCGICTLNISPKNESTDTTTPCAPP
jgi:hypothetical protein